ncbi:helix-turn-helix domain-containing protein [Streptosporangium subroseum]|uniref:helix-turn-helix domain-containing protein n=1 Tax=Streptosporangium subroseum TaxID=106412 RepID=UPI00308875E0|nr:helix-turn-helix domain-containing protein [Streptosporangium subroseum]
MVLPTAAVGDPAPVRLVNDVETLRVLSDPLRLAILRLLMRGASQAPPILSVKEMAAELEEPPTKLYRHVKQLEACGLIVVAETRLVSGIVEYRYRTGQFGLRWDSALLGQTADPSDHLLAIDIASCEGFLQDYAVAVTTGKVRLDQQTSPETSYRNPVSAVVEARLSPQRAMQLRGRLAALVGEYFDGSDDEDGVPVHMSLIFYSPED